MDRRMIESLERRVQLRDRRTETLEQSRRPFDERTQRLARQPRQEPDDMSRARLTDALREPLALQRGNHARTHRR